MRAPRRKGSLDVGQPSLHEIFAIRNTSDTLQCAIETELRAISLIYNLSPNASLVNPSWHLLLVIIHGRKAKLDINKLAAVISLSADLTSRHLRLLETQDLIRLGRGQKGEITALATEKSYELVIEYLVSKQYPGFDESQHSA